MSQTFIIGNLSATFDVAKYPTYTSFYIANGVTVQPLPSSGAIGVQIDVSGATLTNQGSIVGGSGVAAGFGGTYIPSMAGGAGVYLTAGSLVNAGSIRGGGISNSSYGNVLPPAAGVGVNLVGGLLTNSGSIYGGAGGSSLASFGGGGVSGGVGGAGVQLSQADAAVASTLINTGLIWGGVGGYPFGLGGAGVVIVSAGATASNQGTILGGYGAVGGAFGGTGGTGVALTVAGATFDNLAGGIVQGGGGGGAGFSSFINGSSSGGTGGVGATIAAGASLDNAQGGLIFGGNGGVGRYEGGGGRDAVELSGGTLTNGGALVGGNGAPSGSGGGPGSSVAGGAGGAGLVVSSGSAVNTGSIGGGAGGAATVSWATAGAGGVGVYLGGGTLTTSGSIAGGLAGGSGVQADSVQFTSAPAILVVESGAIFAGAIGGFAVGDTVDMTNLSIPEVSAEFNAATTTLTTPTEGILQFAGNFADDVFTFSADPSGTGTDVTLTRTGVSSALYAPVILGSAGYTSPLTVTATGRVAPFGYGPNGAGIDAVTNAAGFAATLVNQGSIIGGAGYAGGFGPPGGLGGTGVALTAGGSFTNSGSVSGGAGGRGAFGSSTPAYPGVGGTGVLLTGVTFANSGSITGGTGGYVDFNQPFGAAFTAGAGGAGAIIQAGSAVNTGSIQGGSAGTDTGGNGGVGVDITAATLTNDGNLTGGSGGSAPIGVGSGGAALVEHAGAVVDNAGTIDGGSISVWPSGLFEGTGGAGAIVEAGAQLVNSGAIDGGGAPFFSGVGIMSFGVGGVGVYLNGGTVTTSGSIAGGSGGGPSPNSPTGVPTQSDAVQFGSAGGTLVVESGASFQGAIGGFSAGDVIDITNLAPTQVQADLTVNGATRTLTTATDGTLQFAPLPAGEQLVLSDDGSGGTDITLGQNATYLIPGSNATVDLATFGSSSNFLITSGLTLQPPATSGAVGLLADVAGSNLMNDGSILGGTGAYGTLVGGTSFTTTSGGGGLYQTAGTVDNAGIIHGGGVVVYSSTGTGAGSPGVGVNLGGGSLINSGAVYGGNGPSIFSTFAFGGAGAAGMQIDVINSATPSSLINNGTIEAGAGGTADNVGGPGGTGVMETGQGALASNHGVILGGAGSSATDLGGSGGRGIVLSYGAVFYNQTGGIVSAGAGGGGGQGGLGGTIQPGAGFGGIGAYVKSSNLYNLAGASIQGGAGASSSYAGSAGGAGVELQSGSLYDAGTVIGGAGGAASSSFPGQLGTHAGGAGGAGVVVDFGSLTVVGVIQGGNGGAGFGTGAAGSGGAGVYLDGGNVTTSGSLVGGYSADGVQADAVQFGPAGGTLVVQSGASFSGAIGGFAQGDVVDIANLTPVKVTADFNALSYTLTTLSDGTLQFGPSFTGQQFVFTADGKGGTDVTLAQAIAAPVTQTVTVGSGSYSTAVAIAAGATVAPTQAGATGVAINVGGASVSNAGAIVGGSGGVGVSLTAAATVTNAGSISGGSVASGPGGAGVYLNGGTLVSYGTISGGTTAGLVTGAAVQFGTAASTLVVQPGAAFYGQVAANAATNDVLKLAGTVDPTLQGFGTQFTGFTTLEFGSGAAWVVDSTTTAATALKAITGFAVGDRLDLTDLNYVPGATATLANGGLSVQDGSTAVQLDFQGNFAGEQFVLTADPAGIGTEVSLEAACYLRGTRILTATGERPIETLAIGDKVKTVSRELLPIRWIGRRRHRGRSLIADETVQPVRIRAGALGEGVPHRDLWVSPEHAILCEGVLIPAAALINGSTVVQEETLTEVEYFHVELERHEVILAEGAPSESYVDNDSRERFDNAAEYAARYPDAVRLPARFYAQRVEEGEALERVRRMMRKRAALKPGEARAAGSGGAPMWLSTTFWVAAGCKESRRATSRTARRIGAVRAQ